MFTGEANGIGGQTLSILIPQRVRPKPWALACGTATRVMRTIPAAFMGPMLRHDFAKVKIPVLLSARFFDFYEDFLCALCLLSSATERDFTAETQRTLGFSWRPLTG